MGLRGCAATNSSTDLIMLVMSERGADKLLESKFTLGAEGSVAAAANLEGNAPTLDPDGGRSGPSWAAFVSAGQVSFPIFPAEHERRCLKVRHNHDAVSVFEQFLRNALIRSRHDL